MERDSSRKGNQIGPARAEGSHIDIHELALPQLAECHFLGIECEADPLRVADRNAAVVRRSLAPTNFGDVTDLEFVRFAREPSRFFCPTAVTEVVPKSFELLRGVAAEDLGQR